MLPKIVFMGTPDFAVPSLQSLIDAGYPISLVITQPDKPVGRKQVLTPPPVKILAEAHGIPVFQPAKIKTDPEVFARLQAEEADLFVVVAYGKILPQALLDLPKRGCINVHASLLPFYRGAAPIQWSIVRGESETGVTTMLMDVGMDTGDMLLQAKLPILDSDTGVTLSQKLAELGAQTLLTTLPQWLDGSLQATPQDHTQATTISLINKAHGHIDWNQSARSLFNLVRGFKPWPEAYTTWDGKNLKIKAAQVYAGDPLNAQPGHLAAITPTSIVVGTGDGLLEVVRVHLADSKEMAAGDFARGKHLQVGDAFGI